MPPFQKAAPAASAACSHTLATTTIHCACVHRPVSAQAAAEFCKSPQIKKQSCGWAPQGSDAEGSTKKSPYSLLGGTMWSGWLKQSELPYTFESFEGSYHCQPGESWVPLACRPGRLLVRVVFKLTELPKSGLVGAVLNPGGVLGTLGSNPSDVTRCDLQLPSHKAGDSKSEVEAALRSKEVNCKTDYDALKDSDTVWFDFAGCDGVSKPGAKYSPTIPYITRNPGPGFIVAKFEVQEAK